MPNQGITTLQQLMQQLQNPAFAQNSMNGLDAAGIGAQNPQQFFQTPMDEQMMRQAVMQKVMGYYGGGGMGQAGPHLPGQQFDPYTGGAMGQPQWAQQGFDNKFDWKQAGRPQDGGNMFAQPYMPNPSSDGGPIQHQNPMQGLNPNQGGPQMWNPSMGGGQGMPYGNDTFGGGQQDPNFYGNMQQYNPNVSGLNTDYASMIQNGFQQVYGNDPRFQGGGMASPGSIQQGNNPFGQGGGFPQLDQQTQNALNQQTQAQMGQIDMDFGGQKQDLLNNLFGRGVNASTIATDAGGKLLYGRNQLQQQAYANQASQETELRKALLEARTKSGGGVGGGGGGGITQTGSITDGYAPQDFTNLLAGQLGGRSGIPLSFDQQMQLADMQLKQAGLQQQGQLGFGGLGLQRELGLGSQGLQGQGLQQDFLSQLMGQGLARQQGAAGFNQSDMARLQQYLLGQQGMQAQLGSQQAQLQAQQQPFWKQLLMGALGGGSSLLSGMATGGTGLFHP